MQRLLFIIKCYLNMFGQEEHDDVLKEKEMMNNELSSQIITHEKSLELKNVSFKKF